MRIDRRIFLNVVTVLAAASLALVGAPLHSEIVDRIVAVVDNRVITWSGALEEENVRAFQDGDPSVETLSDQELQRLIPKMVDQELLAREKDNSPFSAAGVPGVIDPLQEIRKRYSSPEEFRAALVRYHLSETEVVRQLMRRREILEFVDYRLRPEVLLAPDAAETYYRNVLLPQLDKAGDSKPPPPLDEVRAGIERILTEQEINRLLDDWVKQLRSRAKITLFIDSE